jgi:hypothetical protein
MEKIKLNNEQIFDLIPMGIMSNIYDKTRSFSFVSNLGYDDIETAFGNPDNISVVKYYSASSELLKTYTDCKSLKAVKKEFNKEYEDGKFADVYTVTLEIE